MQKIHDLVVEVKAAHIERSKLNTEKLPSLQADRGTLESQCKGWAQSLAKPDLPGTLRVHLEEQYAHALERIAEIEMAIAAQDAEATALDHVVNVSAIKKQLEVLSQTLTKNNPGMGNIELAHHIDRIVCYADGRVVVRTCRLGVLADAVELFKEPDGDATRRAARPPVSGVVPRRLTRRRVDFGNATNPQSKARAVWATDPNRFADLDEKWFEELEFHVPRRISWAEEHALEVAGRRKLGDTEEQIAKHFGKSVPTIRASLGFAREVDPELLELPRRMPRAKWHEVHARDVAEKKQAGMTTVDLAKYYGKSDTTIRSAINHAKALDAKAEGANG